METQTDRLRLLAEKYRAGSCSPAEIEQIKQWYDAFEENGYPLPEEAEIDRASLSAANRVIASISQQQKKSRIRMLFVPMLKVAAVLLLVASGAVMTYRYQHRTQPVVYKEIATIAGEKKQITLPDGSVIWLNSVSSIRYPETFNGDVREVHLKGEAFFKVFHDRQHPFLVYTGKLKVQVLGTSFDVKAYNENHITKVSVATGKVGVVNPDTHNPKSYMLLPGDQLNCNSITGSFIKSRIDTADITGWQQNVLAFNFETLENISYELQRAYDVQFVFKNKALLKKQFKLKVKDESLVNILKLLSISGDRFKYRLTGKQVIIE